MPSESNTAETSLGGHRRFGLRASNLNWRAFPRASSERPEKHRQGIGANCGPLMQPSPGGYSLEWPLPLRPHWSLTAATRRAPCCYRLVRTFSMPPTAMGLLS
jgi:hypothetical protein